MGDNRRTKQGEGGGGESSDISRNLASVRFAIPETDVYLRYWIDSINLYPRIFNFLPNVLLLLSSSLHERRFFFRILHS